MEQRLNLLAISYCLPPLINPQSFQIGRLLYHLPPLYKMHVVTAEDNSFQKDFNLYSDLHERFTEEIVIDNSLAHKLRLPAIFLSWHIRAYREIVRKWKGKQFDAIVTFSHPIAANLLGLWLKRYFNVPWIAFLSDPWVDNPYYVFKGLKRKIHLYFERKVMETADTLVFASPELRDVYTIKYPFITGKFTFIEHSYAPNLYKNILAPSRSGRPQGSPLLLRYLGGLYGKRTAENLLEAIGRSSLADNREFLFEVIGSVYDKQIEIYSNIVNKYNLHQAVKFTGSVPYLDSLRLMQESDVLVIIDAPIDGSVFLPSKLIDYIGAGRPILAITPCNGAAARVVKKTGGWLVEPNDVDGIVKALREILDNYKNGKLEQFKPSIEKAKEYAISHNVNKFVNILNGKIKKPQ